MVNRRTALFSLAFCVLISSPVFAVTRSWTGAVSANWSDPANWSPSGTPASGDPLVFPAGAPHSTMTNDLPAGTSVGPMTFNASYTLNGNPLTLTGDLSFANGANIYVVFICNADLKLGSSLRFGPAISSFYNGAIDVNEQTLTIDTYNTSLSGAVNGSGAIVANGSGIRITNGGTFTGTLLGVADVQGSMPGANITTNRISGNGTIGTVTGGSIVPGAWDPSGSADPHVVGVLHTKTVAITGLSIDLYPSASSDLLQVTGAVNVAGALQVSIPSGSPTAGQSFTIIDNDGADSVNGTFNGLPEGGTLSFGTSTMAISYHGGDGNDVVLTTLSSTRTWNGTFSGLWSDPRNWSPQSIPAPGEPLLFPAGASNSTMTNDLPAGTSVGPMTFNASYTLNGNPLTLNGDLSFANGVNIYVVFICNADLKLGSSLRFGPAISSFYNGAIDVNGQTLTIDTYNTSLNGAVNGSGAIVANGSGIRITNGGTFAGTLLGVADVQGSMPGVNITTNRISGNATIGTVTGGSIAPGAWDPSGSADPHVVGVLHTKTVSITGLSIDLYPSASSDLLQVTGTVTIGGALQVTIPSGSPAAGQSFTIIDNDGADPVNGTFNGLPEGATLSIGTSTMAISYHGGDGNDVVLTTLSAIKSWNGTYSGSWSDGRNWSPQGVPSPAEALLFPVGAATKTMTNDLPAGTSVGPMTFNDSYTLNGNLLTLTGDLAFANGVNIYVVFTCNATLKLGSSVRFGPAISSFYNGAIDVNGQTLTIDTYNTSLNGAVNGSGAIVANGSGIRITSGGTFTGTLVGVADVQGSIPGANITGNKVSGNGTIGTVNGGSIAPGAWDPSGTADPHVIGVLHTKTAAMTGLNIDLNPSASSDQVQVTGTVTVAGALQLSLAGGAPGIGATFTIIDNDGTDPVNGIFTNLPEGAIVASGPYRFRISYVTGDGNDVTLSALIETTSALSQSAATSVFGEQFTLTATVSASSGTPTGSVMFTSDGATIGTEPLVNGVATLTATTLNAGTHSIVSTFLGTGAFADSVSGSVSHVVVRGQTKAQVVADHANSSYGQTVRFTVTVTPQSPASGQPGGSVTVLADGNVIGTVPVVNGTATFETASFHPGVKSITATYNGDANFEGCTSLAIQQNVGKAQTAVDAAMGAVALVGASPVVNVTVRVPANAALVPAGTVSITDVGTMLDQRSLAGGSASFTLAPLSAGDHRLTVNFSGDADFEASSANVIQSVILPAISFHGTRVDEGNRGVTVATIVVSLSAPVQVPVRVSFSTLGGNAAEGEDYEKASGVIEFAPGQVTRSIELHIAGDTFPEADETFSVLLSDPVNATIDTPSAAIVITNDDQIPPRRRPARH